MNLDCQLLLANMGAHKAALPMLSLPFTHHEILAEDLEVRAVVRAVYRLIKGAPILFTRKRRSWRVSVVSSRFDVLTTC